MDIVKREHDFGDADELVGVGRQIEVNGQIRREAIEFGVKFARGKSDDELRAIAKPHLDEWERRVRLAQG